MTRFQRRLGALAMGFLTSLAASAAEDQPFVTAASGNLTAHMAVAEVGVQRATDERLKAFARKWLDDSKAIEAGLATSAKAAGAELDAPSSARPSRIVDELAALEPAAFDARFARIAATSVDRMLLGFREAAQDAQDARLKSFAEQSLPLLEQNLAAANTLQDALGKTLDPAANVNTGE